MRDTIAILCVAAACFLGGILYTVHNAEIYWTDTELTIYLHGLTWEFPCYNGD